MKCESLYWIFSTLPQVLAALTGLVIAALTIYDQHLNSEIQRDSSLEDILVPLKKKISRRAYIFFAVSMLAIIVDVVVLGIADKIAPGLTQLFPLSISTAISPAMMMVIICLLNCGALVLLVPIMRPVLSPNEWEKVRDKEKDRTLEALNKETSVASPPDNPQPPSHQENEPSEPEKSQFLFIKTFRQFEKTVREFFPFSSKPGSQDGLSMLVRRLVSDKILPDKFQKQLRDIIRLRNLYVHGGDIGFVHNSIIKTLEDVTKILHSRLKGMEDTIFGPKAQVWSRWIEENVDDLDEAYNLDQAIRYSANFGEYRVSITGYHLIITPVHGERLVLSHSEIPEFLNFLERRFTSNPGFSLEEEKSFQDALAKIREEDD